MDNKIEIFKNEQFGEVRTILEGEKVLFCAADVAKALGYTNPNKAVNDHWQGYNETFYPYQRESSEYQLHPGRRRLSAHYSQQTSCG